AETVYSQTVSLPPPHSSNCLGDSLRLEIKRTLIASVGRTDLECNYEQLKFASQIPSPTFNSPLDY
ncbi:hypothetical protein ABXW19_10475, partial [Streptococcus suis]